MKKKYNKNIIILLTLSCFSLTHSFSDEIKKISLKKEDCVDCYISVPSKKIKEKVYKYDSNLSVSYSKKEEEKDQYMYALTEDDTYQKNLNENKELNPIKAEDSLKIAIQIGAFRKYAGAKVYAKKYDLLSNKYEVKIEAGVKDQKPLYRVKIKGFLNKGEANEFKRQYGLTGAFLVMK